MLKKMVLLSLFLSITVVRGGENSIVNFTGAPNNEENSNYNQNYNTHNPNYYNPKNNPIKNLKQAHATEYLYSENIRQISVIKIDQNIYPIAENQREAIIDSLTKDTINLSINKDKYTHHEADFSNTIKLFRELSLIDNQLVSQYSLNLIGAFYYKGKKYTKDSIIGKKLMDTLNKFKIISTLYDNQPNQDKPPHIILDDLIDIITNEPEFNLNIFNKNALEKQNPTFFIHNNIFSKSDNKIFVDTLNNVLNLDGPYINIKNNETFINATPLTTFFDAQKPWYTRYSKLTHGATFMGALALGMYLQYRFGYLFLKYFPAKNIIEPVVQAATETISTPNT